MFLIKNQDIAIIFNQTKQINSTQYDAIVSQCKPAV